MLLRLRKNLGPSELESVLAVARDLDLATRFLDAQRTVLELVGPADPRARSRFEDLAAVSAVLDSSDQPELVDRTRDRADTVVHIAEALFGGDSASLIAGPCAVESAERLFEIAASVRAAGAALLRGGAYKPRTSPHSFQGLGAQGLALLAEARARTGLGIVTEVLDPRDVEVVGRSADAFQIGSRSMANAALLVEVGKSGKPVLLKRGLAATVREFLLAAEYVLAQGNPNVILCERGIRGFDKFTRNVLDVGAVAHLKLATHLPVVVDPSHAAGRADLVRPLARAGMAAGADGLVIETHPAPHEVHSDGAQAVSLALFAEIARDAQAILALDERHLRPTLYSPLGSPQIGV